MRLMLALSLSLAFAACDEDHDHSHHDHDHGELTAGLDDATSQMACAMAANPDAMIMSVDALSEADVSLMAGIEPATGLHEVTLAVDGANYVVLETLVEHTDGSLFAHPAGHVKAFWNGDAQLESAASATANCSDIVAEDWRVHMHMPQSYIVEVHGSAGDTVTLMWLNAASDHSTVGGDHSGHGG